MRDDDISAEAEDAIEKIDRKREDLVYKGIVVNADFRVSGIHDLKTVLAALEEMYEAEPFTAIRMEIFGERHTLSGHAKLLGLREK